MNLKKFYAFGEDKPPIYYRPGTSDEAIIQAVIIDRKEYLFPRFEPQLIWDVGANIGIVTAVMANIYPNATIYAFEPEAENYKILGKNVSDYTKVITKKFGLGNKVGDKEFYFSDDPTNLGGFSTHIESAKTGEKIQVWPAFFICQEYGTPGLIKIDCEGAEHDVLTDIPDIHKVRWITGELHGVNDYALLGHLDKHFRMSFARGFGDKVWHFHALAKSWTDFGLDHAPQR